MCRPARAPNATETGPAPQPYSSTVLPASGTADSIHGIRVSAAARRRSSHDDAIEREPTVAPRIYGKPRRHWLSTNAGRRAARRLNLVSIHRCVGTPHFGVEN